MFPGVHEVGNRTIPLDSLRHDPFERWLQFLAVTLVDQGALDRVPLGLEAFSSRLQREAERRALLLRIIRHFCRCFMEYTTMCNVLRVK